MADDSLARRIAGHLLDVRAVSFAPEEPFTWASGRKAPVYCDNRITISYPVVRRAIRDAFARCLEDHLLRPEVIAGTATAGIPHAAWLADRLDLPLVYVRSSPKRHGRGSQIEGRIEPGQAAVVVEDLVSTGGSSRGVVDALRAAGVDVRGVLAIVSYELEAARQTYDALRVPLHVLTRFDDLFQEAAARGMLSDASVRSIEAWRADPVGWSDRHA